MSVTRRSLFAGLRLLVSLAAVLRLGDLSGRALSPTEAGAAWQAWRTSSGLDPITHQLETTNLTLNYSDESETITVDTSLNEYDAQGTAPRDHVEGVGKGATLVPQSLYRDQLKRRLGRR